MTKSYEEELEGREKGLEDLNRIIDSAKDRRTYEKALVKIPIQKARIESFKEGYEFCKKELNAQKKLGKDSHNN